MSDKDREDRPQDPSWPLDDRPVRPVLAWLIVNGKVVETKVLDDGEDCNDQP